MHIRPTYMVVATLAVAVVSFVFVFFASRNLSNDKPRIRLHVFFPITEGIEPGIDVKFFGDVVGRVVRVKNSDKELLVELAITEEPKINRSFVPCFVLSDIDSKRSQCIMFRQIEKSILVESFGLSSDQVELPYVNDEVVTYGQVEGIDRMLAPRRRKGVRYRLGDRPVVAPE